MRSRATIFFVLLVCTLGVVLATAYYSLTSPHGKLVARVQRKDTGGYVHSVTVRQFSGRFRTELSSEGEFCDLPVSTFELYEGSDPITAASISWPDLRRFSVRFNNGITVDCTWNETNCTWTRR